jgi:hypothetical protein
MSLDPFDQIIDVDIAIKGNHPTLGMILEECAYRARPRLTDMALSTPGSRVPKWRSTLRNTYLTQINGVPVDNITHITNVIAKARQERNIKIKCSFACDKSYGIHPFEGVPQLYFDQLNIIAQHIKSTKEDELATIKQTSTKPNDSISTNNTESSTGASNDHTHMEQHQEPKENLQNACASEKLTETFITTPNDIPTVEEPKMQMFKLQQLLKRVDWPDWQQSKYKQLDQYHEQGMFSDPMEAPRNANVLRMLWTYVLKADGTKKSRMVCNGNPGEKGTITLGHTYANALDATSERIFWAIAAKHSMIVEGADVSNAFAEAPQAPLYLLMDDFYKEWWEEHLGKPKIPEHHKVIRVNNAIQGHPESPRLWEKHIGGIL